MNWQEKLFQQTWHWFQRQIPQPKRNKMALAHSVRLQEVQAQLTIFARLLNGTPIELMTAEAEGGYRDQCFYLPERFQVGQNREENLNFYLFRIAYLSQQRTLKLNWPPQTSHALQDSRLRAWETRHQVLSRLWEDLPALEAVYDCLLERLELEPGPDSVWLPWGHWMSALATELDPVGPPASDSTEATLPEQTTTELNAPAREEIELLQIDSEAVQKYTLQHYYEKVETLESFQGSWRDCDGSDDLSEHAEALQELDLRQVVRCDTPVHSVLRSEFLPGASAPESREQKASGYFLSYDEWDQKKRRYRKQHCRVYPQQSRLQDPSYVHTTRRQQRHTLNVLRQRFQHFFTRLEQVSRQTQGDDLDLDSMVEYFSDRHAGCTPSERLYLARRRRQPDLSLLLLLDLSLSSDGYTGGQRILDVEKQAVILFAELLSEYGVHFQIDGFSSRTRHHCDYLTFKPFHEPWSRCAARVGAAEARGYTRIGPALRHACTLLRPQRAHSRWIVLLSDGKPNDYDRYEGNYGLADVRQAIREARREQIQVYGLAIESQARHYLPLMLGHGAYRILPHPQELPTALAEFYRQLLRR